MNLSRFAHRRPARHPLKALPLVAALLAGAPLSLQVQAAPALAETASPEPGAAAAPVAGSRTYRLSLRQLGAQYPLQLRGVQGTGGVLFDIRSDEVVTAARLRLRYAYSPALLSELSHIKVLVNEQVAATLPVPREDGGKSLQRDIPIPPRMITEFNRLNLQLIGHYTTDCEDPAHSSLWADIGNDSELELTVTPVAVANDLALLPQPFFDRRDMRPLVLPVVFGSAPGREALEAAGTLASWFGSLATYRGARFPASVGQLPAKGHAILMAPAGELPAGLTLPSVQGPTVAILSHPSDPFGKLLVITGRNAADLRTAARAVAVGSAGLSGAQAAIVESTELRPRKPYDAPNWLAGDRPVRFGELAAQDTLNVAGYSPDLIRINFHLPPDLFGWREKGIPIDLKYRYSARTQPDKSTLNINVNGQFLRSLPLRAESHQAPGLIERWVSGVVPRSELVPAREKFHVPLFKLPAQTQLQFHYHHEIHKQEACKDVLLDNVRGTVEPDSTVDISGLSHFLAMPNLAAFANSGFPFTRLADLSETAVVLPGRPAPEDLSAYLTLMGTMGRATGYPATAVTVADAARVRELADKDLLVLGTPASQPLLKEWGDALPIRLDGTAKRFEIADFANRLFTWWDPEQREGAKPARAAFSFKGDSTDGLIAGFESPLAGGRSVVVLASNQPGGLAPVTEALLEPERVKLIQGSAALVRGGQVDSLVAEQTYHVGRLNPLVLAQWYLSRHPLLLALMGGGAALLAAVVAYLSLRARARARLAVKGGS